MANSPAAISYPHFKDLEKSNNTFVEALPSPKKSRRNREKIEHLVDTYTKSATNKENISTEYSVVPGSDISQSNTVKVKKKEIKILPTLEEKDEKTESSDRLDMDERNIRNGAEFPKLGRKSSHTGNRANEEVKLESRFSNHTLVNNNSFMKAMNSEHTKYNTENRVPPRESSTTFLYETKIPDNESCEEQNIVYNNNSLIKYNSSHGVDAYDYVPIANNCQTQIVKYGQNIPTIMPNTSEFQGLNLTKKIEKPIDPPILQCNQNLESKLNTMAREESNVFQCQETDNQFPSDSIKSKFQTLRFVLVTLWAFTFTGVLIYMALTNVAEFMVNDEDIPMKYEYRNYEICLLIGRNLRRLIVSLI